MTTSSAKKIGLIICSQRQPRVCPQIAAFVLSTLQPLLSQPTQTTPVELSVIDLLEWNLPMFNEPTIPTRIKNLTDYAQPYTCAWSLEIQKYSAFIFVMLQYNWGYPASVKNAIDYLFNEWVGKPAMIVSYGGHGGAQGAAQLEQVLNRVGMRPVGTKVALGFPNKAVLKSAAEGASLDLDGPTGVWEGEKEAILKAFRGLVGLLEEGTET
jgi:NAD(P)H-dependent FMN reductase